ncbi:helix-turn-helix transcriptional regulator [Roseateles sp. BYS180W]|uniref:Helix-turn-helix transcriptional regulator n=1 Tax=Roseateles rivi TaxID=3299028 RepID=A0ABW7FYX2_9BURK
MKDQSQGRSRAIVFDDLPDDAYLRVRQLILDGGNNGSAILPVSRATLWRMVNLGKFPAPRKISAGVTAWQVGAVRKWLLEQKEGGRK